MEGEILRERLPGEPAPNPCDYGCAGEECAAEAGFPVDPEAAAIARTWALCGGRERRCWPRAGALEEQDAGTVALFESIDALVANARARAERTGLKER